MAKGAWARGKKIAFGDGKRVIWDANSRIIFDGNPNIAPLKATMLNTNTQFELEWVPFYKGHRIYNTWSPGRWIWNYEFRCIPGEIYLTKDEKQYGKLAGEDFVLIEPNPSAKSPVANKAWPFERYEEVARTLKAEGHTVLQLNYRGARPLKAARLFGCPSFRIGLAVMARARHLHRWRRGFASRRRCCGRAGRGAIRGLRSSRSHRLRPARQSDRRCGGLWFAQSLRPLCRGDAGDRGRGGAGACQGAIVPSVTTETTLQRRVAGYHDIRLDGILDLTIRAKGASVLDVGCNRGLVAFEMANNGARVVHGCDNYAPGVETARGCSPICAMSRAGSRLSTCRRVRLRCVRSVTSVMT